MDGSTGLEGAAYRRGTVFGLTVGEVFILLLFLLMLLFLALSQEWEQQNLKTEEKLVEVAAVRDALAAAASVERDRIRTLTRQRDQARSTREQLLREVQRTREAAAEANERADQAALVAADARRLLDGDRTEVLREAQAAREDAVMQIAAANERAERARLQANLLAKGENPPCWYRKVPDGEGGEREKPYYSFEVGVFDDHLLVRHYPTPPGGAEDDNGGSFADEAERLGFQALPYGQRLSDAEFERHFSPTWRAGKNRQVRSYSCIFWVRVWDQTAPAQKVVGNMPMIVSWKGCSARFR